MTHEELTPSVRDKREKQMSKRQSLNRSWQIFEMADSAKDAVSLMDGECHVLAHSDTGWSVYSYGILL